MESLIRWLMGFVIIFTIALCILIAIASRSNDRINSLEHRIMRLEQDIAVLFNSGTDDIYPYEPTEGNLSDENKYFE